MRVIVVAFYYLIVLACSQGKREYTIEQKFLKKGQRNALVSQKSVVDLLWYPVVVTIGGAVVSEDDVDDTDVRVQFKGDQDFDGGTKVQYGWLENHVAMTSVDPEIMIKILRDEPDLRHSLTARRAKSQVTVVKSTPSGTCWTPHSAVRAFCVYAVFRVVWYVLSVLR